MRIGVLFNCLQASLSVALRALIPEAEVLGFEHAAIEGNAETAARAAAALAACDHVISMDVNPAHGPLATRVLSQAVRRFHLMPAFHFGGFHPDTIYVWLDGRPVPGPAGGYQSRIVAAGVLAGLHPDEIIALFNPLVFGRLRYFDAIAEQTALLLEKWAAYGIDLAPDLARWMEGGCFMHTVNHPRIEVVMDLARIACGLMGVAPARDAAPPPDPLARGTLLPFLPELAARARMAPSGIFRDPLPAEPISLPAYVARCAAALARAPLSSLRAAQGVADAQDALDLPTKRRPARAMHGETCLLGWHGALIRVEAASGMLVQEPPWPEGDEAADFLFTARPGADGALTTPALGGLSLEPAGDGITTVSRQGLFLSAMPGRRAASFGAARPGAAEHFLRLPRAALATLRRLLSQGWRVADHGDVPPALVRLLPGFVLEIGPVRLDLRQGPPQDLSDGSVQAVLADGSAVILWPLAPDEDAPAQEIALRPAGPGALPEDAGSLPEFRTRTDGALTLDGAEEIIHPPITIRPDDARRLLGAWRDIGLGARTMSVRVIRGSGKMVLLAPGLDGVLLDRSGVLKDAAAIGSGPRALPPGIRRAAGNLLLDASLVREAPVISGPAVIALRPDARSEQGWLLGTILPLLIMAPLLPREARLVLPSALMAGEAGAGRLALLACLGLDAMPRLLVDGPVARAEDAIWLSDTDIAALPANALQRARAQAAARLGSAPGPRQRLFLHGKGAGPLPALLTRFLEVQRFTRIDPDAMVPAERLRAFGNAEAIIATPGAGQAYGLFCREGVPVLELAPEDDPRPTAWLLSEKLNLVHAVLTCPFPGGAPQPDMKALRGLWRMARLSG